MSKPWEFIAQCLRAELADYGALLHLFENQQRSLFERNPDAVLNFATEIEVQVRSVADSRGRREQAVAEFATENGVSPASSLRSMLPLIENDARPLIEALISEVNLLLHRVRRTSRHNHTMLSRAVEMHQDTLQQLRPQAFTKTYSPAGRLAVSIGSTPGTLRAAG
ncbi:flagellar protein FlgN [Horticoccus sp. 23ND18S-11]|uniref:flagellar protein FlgN n=1 Tax=Horticoccus sp. 23ND18S-11 TaxID=3391832 RepID=UPI0039C8F9A9